MAGDATDFTINIDAPDGSVAQAASTMDRLVSSLATARSAAEEASAAMNAGQASYDRAQAAADKAAKAVERIGIAADAQRGKLQAALDAGDAAGADRAAAKLANLVARQGEAATKAQAAAAAMNAEAAALDRLKANAANAANAEAQIAKQLDAAKGKVDLLAKAQNAASGTGKVNEIAEGLGKLGGPLGKVGQQAFGAVEGFKKLGASLGSAGPYVAVAVAIVAIATAVATVTAAAIAGVAAVTAWAVQLADGARTQQLLSDGIAGTVEGGRALDAVIRRLGTVVPQTRDELLQMAGDLAKTGLKGKELGDALESAAIKAAKAKFGPEFQKQTLSLANQTARLKGNISELFSGLKIEKLLEGFSKLVELFDSTTVTGRAIKVVFESLFQPLVDGLVAFIPKMVSAFIQFEILVLKALIAIKPFGSQIKYVAEVLGVLAVIVAAMTGGFILAVITPFIIIIGLAAGVVAAFMEVYDAISTTVNMLSSMSLVEIGVAMIQGLANGITGAAGAVLSAITGVVGGAVNAAKNMLGIASPSKVFAEIGGYTAEGMAGGVDDGAGRVQASFGAMVAPPASPATAAGSGGAAAPAAARSTGASIVVQTLNVTAPAGTDPVAFANALADALENLGAMSGVAVAT